MTSVLTFQDTHFDVVERNNQLYLDAYQIGTALGYSDPRTAVRKIFNRNKDEFSSGMSEVINLMTSGNYQNPYVFSHCAALTSSPCSPERPSQNSSESGCSISSIKKPKPKPSSPLPPQRKFPKPTGRSPTKPIGNPPPSRCLVKPPTMCVSS